MMSSKTTWLVAAVPSLVWSRLLYPDMADDDGYNALWKQILSSSRADGTDPLADWDDHLENLKRRRTWMTDQNFTKLTYTNGLGTNLTIELPEMHIWQGGAEETTSHILLTQISRPKKSTPLPRLMASTESSIAQSPLYTTAT